MSLNSRVVKSDFRLLNEFVRALGDKNVVKVGIMGAKAGPHKGGSITNAELGMVHEFGSSSNNIPPRSFLVMPILQRQQQIMNEVKNAKHWEELPKTGRKEAVLKDVGIAAEAQIQNAFATGGFGQWRRLKPATIRRKGSAAILIETGQLRMSITSKVGAPTK